MPGYEKVWFFESVSCLLTQLGNSALMLAAWEGRTEVVSLLLEAGAKVGLQNEVM